MVRLPPLPTLLLLTAAKSSAAFCPSSIGSSAFVPVRTHHRATSTSALQMNLFDRFSRVARSNLNNILKNLEDPEKLLNQAVEDMQVRCSVTVLYFVSPIVFIIFVQPYLTRLFCYLLTVLLIVMLGRSCQNPSIIC
jgi:hypothetical protein